MARYAIEKRTTVVVRDKECQCRVSVSTADGKDKQFIYASKCSRSHGSQIKELTKRAEHEQSCDVDHMKVDQRDLLTEGRPHKSAWRAVVDEVMQRLGGQAHLTEIYREIEPRRPTGNSWWREKVRQVLQSGYESLGNGRWGTRIA